MPIQDLPLKPIALHLLIALEHEDLHGYALLARLEHLSEGTIKLDPGTLYRWLARLTRSGWLERLAQQGTQETAVQGKHRRRYYRLTPEGRQVLELERGRLQRLLQPQDLRTETP